MVYCLVLLDEYSVYQIPNTKTPLDLFDVRARNPFHDNRIGKNEIDLILNIISRNCIPLGAIEE